MPTYSYACTDCDHRFDAVQAFSDDALTTCPECSGRLRKLFNSVGVVFKGSGFYRTDSRASGKSGKDGSTAGSSGSDSSSAEKSTPATSSSTGGSGSGSSGSGSAGSQTSSSAPATASS